MALSITINKVAVAASFTAGTKVADIAVSGGTSPYAYELATGGDYFQISGTEVQVKADMNIENIQSFSVTATDSTSGTALTVTSDVVYPAITAKIQSRFNSVNKIYKITQDIDLGHGVLTIPSSCTLDFQGGSIRNGNVTFSSTIIRNSVAQIFYNITFTGKIAGEVLVDWFCPKTSTKANVVENILRTSNVVKFDVGTYYFDRTIYINNEGICFLQGVGRDKTTLSFPEDGITFIRTYWWSNFPTVRNMTIYAVRDVIVLNTRPSVNTTASTIQQGVFSHLKLRTLTGYCIYYYLGDGKENYARPFGNIFNDIVFQKSYQGGAINYNPFIYGVMGLQNTFINVRDDSTPEGDYPIYFHNTIGTFKDCNVEFTSYHRKFIAVGKYGGVNSDKLNVEDNIDIYSEEDNVTEGNDLRILNCNLESFLEHPITYYDYTPLSAYFENSTIAIYASAWTYYYWLEAKKISYIGSKDLKFKGNFNDPSIIIYLKGANSLSDVQNKLEKVKVDTDNIVVQTNSYGVHVLSGASPFISFPAGDNEFPFYRNVVISPSTSTFYHHYVPVYSVSNYSKSDYNLTNAYSFNKVKTVTASSDSITYNNSSLYIIIPRDVNITLSVLDLDSGSFKIPVGTILYFEVQNGGSLTIQSDTNTQYNNSFYVPNYGSNAFTITYGTASFMKISTMGYIGLFKWLFIEELSSVGKDSMKCLDYMINSDTGAYNSEKASFGKYQFSTTLNRPVYRVNANTWVDSNGDTCAIKKGTTEQRPTSVNEGFEYYDSTLKKKILWNGTAWVNMDGTVLEESTALNNIEEIPAREDKTN